MYPPSPFSFSTAFLASASFLNMTKANPAGRLNFWGRTMEMLVE